MVSKIEAKVEIQAYIFVGSTQKALKALDRPVAT